MGHGKTVDFGGSLDHVTLGLRLQLCGVTAVLRMGRCMLPGLCLIIGLTILRHERPWRRYALY